MTLEHVVIAVLVLVAGIYAAVCIRRELKGRQDCCNNCPLKDAQKPVRRPIGKG